MQVQDQTIRWIGKAGFWSLWELRGAWPICTNLLTPKSCIWMSSPAIFCWIRRWWPRWQTLGSRRHRSPEKPPPPKSEEPWYRSIHLPPNSLVHELILRFWVAVRYRIIDNQEHWLWSLTIFRKQSCFCSDWTHTHGLILRYWIKVRHRNRESTMNSIFVFIIYRFLAKQS